MADDGTPQSRLRLFSWSAGGALPAWSVLLIFVVLGRISAVEAVIAAAAVWAVVAGVVWTWFRDYDRLIGYADELVDNPEAPPPVAETSVFVQRLIGGINDLRRLWTDRRDEATALAKSRQDILDSLPDPLLLLDRKRSITGVNAAARALFEQDMTGRDLASVMRDPKVLEA